MPARPNTAAKIKLPGLAKSGSSYARSESIAQARARTGGVGRGMIAVDNTAYPFKTAADKLKFKLYDSITQGWIARAQENAIVRARTSGNTGTGPELCLMGYFLAHGRTIDRDLFFQSLKIYGFRTTKAFVPDVAILGPYGRLIMLPVDGAFFHDKTEIQKLDGEARDRFLSKKGRVVAVADWIPLTANGLITFFAAHGVPL